jgi:hypothetical protein
MLTLNIAYTELVNSSDPLIPTLSREQVWKGLKSKARRPQDFIPSFDDSRVIEERDNGSYIVREAHVAAGLRESPMAGKWTREQCRLHEPVKVRETEHKNTPDCLKSFEFAIKWSNQRVDLLHATWRVDNSEYPFRRT